jgi:hypothetical protein
MMGQQIFLSTGIVFDLLLLKKKTMGLTAPMERSRQRIRPYPFIRPLHRSGVLDNSLMTRGRAIETGHALHTLRIEKEQFPLVQNEANLPDFGE